MSVSLYTACQKGDIERVTELLTKKFIYDIDPNQAPFGTSPLYAAVLNNHLEICKLLVKHGARVDKGSLLYTPLLQAAISEHHEIVKFLIEEGANVNFRDEKRKNLLQIYLENNISTTEENPYFLEIVDLLLEKGCDVNNLCNNSEYLNYPTIYRTSPMNIVCEYKYNYPHEDFILKFHKFGGNLFKTKNGDPPILRISDKDVFYKVLGKIDRITKKDFWDTVRIVTQGSWRHIQIESIRNEIERRNTQIFGILQFQRLMNDQSPFYKDNLPLDLFKLILLEAEVIVAQQPLRRAKIEEQNEK